jgi:hypothetical protein
MSREAVWQQLGYIVGSARNPGYDKLKGIKNKKCVHCNYLHELGQSICRIKMTRHDKEMDTYSYYKCNCNATQELDQAA